MLNRTRYSDGRPEKITYHASHTEALIEALREAGDSAILSSCQESIDKFGCCPCGSQWKFAYCCLPNYLAAQNEAEVLRRAANKLLGIQAGAVKPPAHARVGRQDERAGRSLSAALAAASQAHGGASAQARAVSPGGH